MQKKLMVGAKLSLLVLISTINMNAALLQNVPQTITQPDGNVLNCFATGDEFYNWMHCADGYTIIKNAETGFYVYADKIGNELVPTNLIFGKDNPQALELKTHLLHSPEYIDSKRENWFNAIGQFDKMPNNLQGYSPFDTINQIVILVTWKNGQPFHYPLSYYDTLYNHGDSSFKAYWKEQSYNKLTVNTHLYEYQSPYTRNGVADETECYGEFVKDIIDYVATQVPANLTIDYNNDGFVDNIAVIIQGTPASAWGGKLWPHSVGNHYTEAGMGYASNCVSYAYATSPSNRFGPIRGKLINTFNLNFERMFYSSAAPENILYVLCHEFFHTFGTPDFYVNTGIVRVGAWSLMSNNGNYITMYEKYKYGQWLDSIPTITADGTYTLRHCKQYAVNNCYKIDCPTNPNYFFMLEHRNISKEFQSSFTIPSGENIGLLIYRINKNLRGNNYGNWAETQGEMYVYRPHGTNTNTGNLGQALYNNSYTLNGNPRTAIADTTAYITTPFLEDGSDGGLNIWDITVYPGGDSVSFIVGSPGSKPTVTIHPNSVDLTEGETLSLSIVAMGATSYQWQKNNENILGATSATYTKPDVVLADSGNYRCIAINSNGSDTSNIAVVTVTTISYIVTTSADSGPGSLRTIATTVEAGSKITFAPHITYVNLTGSDITINKDLIIIGSTDDSKITINAGSQRIFNILSNSNVTVNNLIFSGANHNNWDGGGAVLVRNNSVFTATDCEFINNNANVRSGGAVNMNNGIFIATNCNFINNNATSGGAVNINSGTFTATNCNFTNNTASAGGAGVYANNGTFTAINCTFSNNNSASFGGGATVAINSSFTATNCNFTNNTGNSGGAIYIRGTFAATNCRFTNNTGNSGGAVYVNAGIFTATSCAFLNNSTSVNGGAICAHGTAFIGINCTFSGNRANGGGGAIHNFNRTYLYHCTMDRNEARSYGGAVYMSDPSYLLYSYNCIYTGNRVSGNFNQIYGSITAGNNLVQGEGTVTRNAVFGDNELTAEGYVMPLQFARNAAVLTIHNIQVAAGTPVNDIIRKLATDQIGNLRPNIGNTTYGAVEIDGIPPPIYTLTANATTGGTTNPNGDTTAVLGSIITLQATVTNTCYGFKYWIDKNDSVISTSNPLNIEMHSDTILTAIFEAQRFDMDIVINGSGTVSPSSANQRNCGSTVRLTATPTGCYRFANWTNSSGDIVSTSNPLNVVIMRDTILTANFVPDSSLSFNLLVLTDGSGIVEPSTISKFFCDTIVRLEATPRSCHRFVNWTDVSGIEISTNNPLDLEILRDTILTANFVPILFNFAVTSNGNGSVNSSATTNRVPCDTTVTLEAIPDVDYKFVNWTANGVLVSTSNPLTVKVTSDTALTANFAEIGGVNFTIRASEHRQINPSSINYGIPIFIKADEDILDLLVGSLVIEIDRSLFLPRRVDNGAMSLNYIDNILEITFENVRVPFLKADEEATLLTVRGDVLLGEKDSSGIIVKSVDFLGDLNIAMEWHSGYITLDICQGRLTSSYDYLPSVALKSNPVTEVLEVECKVIEVGDYILEVVDLLGNPTTVAEWAATFDGDRIFHFEIPIPNFISGAYLLVLTTPSAKYSTKFVIGK